MTTNYTATVTVSDETDADAVLDALVGYSPVWASRPGARAAVTLSVDAESLPDATTRLVDLVESATRTEALRVEVMTSAEFDRENGLDEVTASQE